MFLFNRDEFNPDIFSDDLVKYQRQQFFYKCLKIAFGAAMAGGMVVGGCYYFGEDKKPEDGVAVPAPEM